MECLLDLDGHILLPTPGDAWFVSGCRMDVIRGRPFNDCVPCWQFHSEVDQSVYGLVGDSETTVSP